MGKGQTDELCGREVLVPARVWPDLKPPKGERGWTGQIKSVKKAKAGDEYIVKFPGDASQYFFPKKDVLSWLLPEQPKPAEQPKAASGKASGAASGSKKRAAEDKPSGSGRASPAKKPAGPPAHIAASQPPPAPLAAAAAAPSPAKSGGRASPSKAPKVTKESLLADLDKLMHRMNTQQMAQLVQEARRILS